MLSGIRQFSFVKEKTSVIKESDPPSYIFCNLSLLIIARCIAFIKSWSYLYKAYDSLFVIPKKIEPQIAIQRQKAFVLWLLYEASSWTISRTSIVKGNVIYNLNMPMMSSIIEKSMK